MRSQNLTRRSAINSGGFGRPPGSGGPGGGGGFGRPPGSGGPGGFRPGGPGGGGPRPGGPRPFGGGPGGPSGGPGGPSGGPGAPRFDRGPRRGPVQKDGPRTNREIRVPEVRVIGEDGSMLGIFPTQEAVRMAEDKGLDLIEVAPTAKPPTCKIADYGKYRYEQKQKDREARKNQVVITIKEIQLRPRTDEHDLQVKLKKAREFILEGDKVKVNLRFYGREMAHQELGIELLRRVTTDLGDVAMVESPPKMEGKQMFVLLAPDKEKIKDYEKKLAETAPKAE